MKNSIKSILSDSKNPKVLSNKRLNAVLLVINACIMAWIAMIFKLDLPDIASEMLWGGVALSGSGSVCNTIQAFSNNKKERNE